MRIAGTIDRLVARRFASSYLLCLGTAAVLFSVVDALLKLDALQRRPGPLWLAFAEAYALELPLLFQRFGAFVTLAGAMFCVARLVRNNELLPIVASGTSVFRALAPVLLGAALLGGLEFATTELVIPRLADRIRAHGGLSGWGRGGRPGILRDAAGHTTFAGDYDPATRTMRWVSVRERGPDGEVLRTWHGDAASWREGAWWLARGWVVQGDRVTEVGPPAGLRLPIALQPIDVESPTEKISLLPFAALRGQVLRQPYLPALRIQLHERITRPLAHLLLVLLGLPFVLREPGARGGVYVGLLALGAIGGAYFFAGFYCRALGAAGQLHPFWAAWLPTVAFGLLGIWLFGRVRT
ncbi:MAG: hypothetical protein KatS3mg102_2473 [Planctomycetota bacterium]|nr:MAG: hypothetical protein KatS3mg102_2473 [Planctomycetota bacterium]